MKNVQYPVKRAERFNTAVTKLGLSANGQTYLDGFRELLTQIGNIIGFVRMVRLAAAETNVFMSDCSETLPFELISNKKETDEQTTNMDEVVSKLANISMMDSNLENDYVEVGFSKCETKK